MAVTINGSTGITTPGITNSGNEIVSGNSAVTGNFSVGGSNISPVQSFRNKIINGNFDFWQRGTSVTGVTNGQFVADRFASGVTGSTVNISRQSFTLGQTDVPNEPTYFHRTVVTSVAGSGNYSALGHSIEAVRTLAGQTATLSFWAKADASKNIAVEFLHNFGTGGSPSSSVTAISVTTCSLTTSWQKFTINVSLPSVSGKTLGTNNDNFLRIWFFFDAGSDLNSRTNSLGQQSGTFDIAQVQLEAGSVATPFEVRPPGVELALCQRYFQTGIMRLRATLLSGTIEATNQLPVSMRATPTVTGTGIGALGATTLLISDTSTGSTGNITYTASAEL
jgi:hypothetical protein